MATLNFPDAPDTGDIYTDSNSGFTYEWNGTVWISKDPSTASNIREINDISGDFNGYATISNQIMNGVSQKRVGIKSNNKSILRSHMKIYNKNNKNIGKITSGGFSPTLNISIAIAYIDKFVSKNVDKLYCLIRNNLEEIEITKLPFVKHNYRRIII